jgi:hypothetical protein
MVINGWRLFVHPLFDQQLRQLMEQVQALAERDSAGYKRTICDEIVDPPHTMEQLLLRAKEMKDR